MKLEPFAVDGDGATEGKLNMSATAKTYRYLQEDEQ